MLSTQDLIVEYKNFLNDILMYIKESHAATSSLTQTNISEAVFKKFETGLNKLRDQFIEKKIFSCDHILDVMPWDKNLLSYFVQYLNKKDLENVDFLSRRLLWPLEWYINGFYNKQMPNEIADDLIVQYLEHWRKNVWPYEISIKLDNFEAERSGLIINELFELRCEEEFTDSKSWYLDYKKPVFCESGRKSWDEFEVDLEHIITSFRLLEGFVNVDVKFIKCSTELLKADCRDCFYGVGKILPIWKKNLKSIKVKKFKSVEAESVKKNFDRLKQLYSRNRDDKLAKYNDISKSQSKIEGEDFIHAIYSFNNAHNTYDKEKFLNYIVCLEILFSHFKIDFKKEINNSMLQIKSLISHDRQDEASQLFEDIIEIHNKSESKRKQIKTEAKENIEELMQKLKSIVNSKQDSVTENIYSVFENNLNKKVTTASNIIVGMKSLTKNKDIGVEKAISTAYRCRNNLLHSGFNLTDSIIQSVKRGYKDEEFEKLNEKQVGDFLEYVYEFPELFENIVREALSKMLNQNNS